MGGGALLVGGALLTGGTATLLAPVILPVLGFTATGPAVGTKMSTISPPRYSQPTDNL